MKKRLLLLAVFTLASCAFAQSSQKISDILASDEITKGEAAYFACVNKNLTDESATEDEAFAFLAGQNLFGEDESAEEKISVEKACFLIARTENMKGGVFYSIMKNPRYALREFKALGIVPSNADPKRKISGEEFIALFNGFAEKGKIK